MPDTLPEGLDRPVLIYDGGCAFCRRWVRRWRRMAGRRLLCIPYQDLARVAGRLPPIPPESLAEAVHLVTPDGCIRRGAEAVVHSLGPRWGWLAWLHRRLPGLARAAEALYRRVARARGRCPAGHCRMREG